MRMESLRQVWQDYKNDMKDILNENDYEIRLKEYMESADYRKNDIEQPSCIFYIQIYNEFDI